MIYTMQVLEWNGYAVVFSQVVSTTDYFSLYYLNSIAKAERNVTTEHYFLPNIVQLKYLFWPFESNTHQY